MTAQTGIVLLLIKAFDHRYIHGYVILNTLNTNTGNFVFQKKTSGRDWYYDD